MCWAAVGSAGPIRRVTYVSAPIGAKGRVLPPFGTDELAPASQETYLKVYNLYAPLFAKLSPKTSAKLRLGNYERLFDKARRDVRAWEAAHIK